MSIRRASQSSIKAARRRRTKQSLVGTQSLNLIELRQSGGGRRVGVKVYCDVEEMIDHPVCVPLFLLVLVQLIAVGSLDTGLRATFRPSQYNDGTVFSVRESSVDMEGLTILSWKYAQVVPEWVHRMLSPEVAVQDASCAMELLGAMRKRVESPFQASFKISGETMFMGTCHYVTSPVGWERFPEVDNPHRPAFFYCPIRSGTDQCKSLREKSCNVSIYIESKAIGKKISSWFWTHSWNECSHGRDINGIGVCTNVIHKGDKMNYYLDTFARYYSALNFDRVVIHDSVGYFDEDLISEKRILPKSVTYLNFTVWDVLGLQLSNGTGNKAEKLIMRQGDQNKAITFTYCRFEMTNLLSSVLIVDTDELPFCPQVGYNMTEQSLRIRDVVEASKTKGIESLTWQRHSLVSLKSNCTLNGTQSILTCFDSLASKCIMNQPRNGKSMHLGLPCPGTDNHVSCESKIWPMRNCKCEVSDGNECYLLHSNPHKCSNAPANQSVMGTELFTHPTVAHAAKHLGIVNELALMMLQSEADGRTVEMKFGAEGVSLKEAKVEKIQVESLPTTNAKRSSVDMGYNSSHVHIFFILTPKSAHVQGIEKRIKNVRDMMKVDPNIRYFLGLYWKNWSTVTTLFKSLRLPNAHMPELRGSRNRRGKYARWASLVMAASYAIQYRLPHIVILEDDSTWPHDLGAQVTRHLRHDNKLVKLSKWGEGYLLSLPCAIKFVQRIYELGINKHSDTWIRDNMEQVTIKSIHYSLVVDPNDGNIYNSAQVKNKVDFPYPQSRNDTKPLTDRLGLYKPLEGSNSDWYFKDVDMQHALFKSSDDLNFTEVASRLDGTLPGEFC